MARFEKGRSGNPAGRPKGIVSQANLREAISNDLPEILAAMLKAAKGGDVAAAKLLLDRTIPPLKQRDTPVKIAITGQDIVKDGQAIIDALGNGQITPGEAGILFQALSSLARVKEIDALERRRAAGAMNVIDGMERQIRIYLPDNGRTVEK